MVDPSSRRVTLNDVAALSGVSYQTVSRVINNHPHVAESTRHRVLRAIEELDYHPNRVARTLAARRSNTLAVVTFGMSYHGPAQMMIHIERAARSAGYDLIFSNITDMSQIDNALQQLSGWQVDGLLVIAPVAGCDHAAMCAISGVPIVEIDTQPNVQSPSVVVDQYLGSQLATQHLIDLGHIHVCEIRGPLEWYGAAARHQAWEDTLHQAELHPGLSIEGDWTAESGYLAVEELLDRKIDFTALVIANDQMALGAMRALRQKGMHIPQDISVVGFDNMPESAFFEPPLTTIHQDFDALGKQGIEYLLEQIHAANAPTEQRLIQPYLVHRESTAPPSNR